MTLPEIETLIPHRPPMLLVDELITLDGHEVCCHKTFRDDEYFVQGHYPNQPIVPGVILCEATMQAGAILLSYLAKNEADASAAATAETRVPVATRLNEVKFKRIVRPGDRVELQVKLNERLADAYFLTGKVMLNGKLAARLDFACALAQPDA